MAAGIYGKYNSRDVFRCSALWDMAEYCHERQLEYQERGMQGRREIIPAKSTIAQLLSVQPTAPKRLKVDNCIEKNIAFFRAHYADSKLFDFLNFVIKHQREAY